MMVQVIILIGIVSLDESFFFYDSLVKRVWIEEGKRPVVRIAGSHQYSCFFGAVDIKGKQLFRQYNKFNADTFLDFLKIIHSKFPRCCLFLDKAPPHFKSRKVKDYLEENKDALVPVYLPTASPEFMMLEEVWNIAKHDLLILQSKHDLLILQYYSSFEDFRQKISNYFRTKRFGLNMRNYLLRSV